MVRNNFPKPYRPSLPLVTASLFILFSMGCKTKPKPQPPIPELYLMEAQAGVVAGGKVLQTGDRVPSGVTFTVLVGGRAVVSASTGEFVLLLYGPGKAEILPGDPHRFIIHSGQGLLSTSSGAAVEITVASGAAVLTSPAVLYFESRISEGYLCLCQGKARIRTPTFAGEVSTPPEHQGWFFSSLTHETLSLPLRHNSRDREEVKYLLQVAQFRTSSPQPNP